MSCYGNSLNTYDSFFVLSEYIERSVVEIDEMFTMTITEADEETGLRVINNPATADPEKVKETIIDKLKKIIQTIVKTVKEAVNKAVQSIKEFYMNSNIVDSIVNKFSDKVTWDNLLKAKENGWKGVPNGIGAITRYAKIQDVGEYNRKLNPINKFDFNNAIEKIHTASSADASKVEYDAFKKELDKFKTATTTEFMPNLILLFGGFKPDSNAKLNSEGTYAKGFFSFALLRMHGLIIDGKDGSHYYPTKIIFDPTKELAEHGERTMKEWSSQMRDVYNEGKLEKASRLDEYKTYKTTKKNNKDIDFTYEMLFHKATFEWKSAQLDRFAKMAKVLISLVADQHRRALNIYAFYYHGIAKYVLKTETDEEPEAAEA